MNDSLCSPLSPITLRTKRQRQKLQMQDMVTTIPEQDPPSAFFTPKNPKLVKPLESAFLSTGLLTRRSRSKNFTVGSEHNNENETTPRHAPETPCKRPLQANPFVMPKVADSPIAFDLPSPTKAQLHTSTRKHRVSFGSPIGRKRLNLGFADDLFSNLDTGDQNDNLFTLPSRPATLLSPAPLDLTGGRTKYLPKSAMKKPRTLAFAPPPHFTSAQKSRPPMFSSSPTSNTDLPSSSPPSSKIIFDATNPPTTPQRAPPPSNRVTASTTSDSRRNVFLSSSSPDYHSHHRNHHYHHSKFGRFRSHSTTQLRSPITSPLRSSPRRRLGSSTSKCAASLMTLGVGDDDDDDDDDDSEEEGEEYQPKLTPASVKMKMMASYARRISMSTPVASSMHVYVTAHPHFLTKEYFEELRSGLVSTTPHVVASSRLAADYFETRFTVLARAGTGEFADVYRVEDKTDRTGYAVKRTKWTFTGVKDRLGQIEEVEHMWAVGVHRHCVRLVAAWEQRGRLYIQTELCEGGSLASFLDNHCQESALEERLVWRTLGEIALGLHHIHNHARLLHLDLKPANILITREGVLKIGDYGMATRWPVTTDIEREGDRTYMAPELLQDQYDRPADVFSLGLILLEMATNVILPENGDEWQRLRAGDLTGCDFAGVSADMKTLIVAMIAPEPGDRPSVRRVVEAVAARGELRREGEKGALYGWVGEREEDVDKDGYTKEEEEEEEEEDQAALEATLEKEELVRTPVPQRRKWV